MELFERIASQLRNHGIETWFPTGPADCYPTFDKWKQTDIFVGIQRVIGAVELAAAPRLRALVSPFLGYDGFDVEAATRQGVLVVRGEVMENAESMAEATIMLILALLYRLPQSEARLRNSGPWGGQTHGARMLKGKTLGIIGYGNIAKAVVARLAAWEPRIVIHSPSTRHNSAIGLEFVELEQLLVESDVIVTLAGLNAGSHHLLDAARLALTKRGVLIVNTARGGLIDEAALAKLAAEGHLGNMALDVFEIEPLPAFSPLRHIPDAILTSHDVGHTLECTEAIVATAVRNIVHLCRGGAPTGIVNPAIL